MKFAFLAAFSAALVMTGVAQAQDKPAMSKADFDRIFADGKKVFAQCSACHQLGEKARNAVGPKLNGLFGRKTGSVEGYNYSAANKGANVEWTEDYFKRYIENPRAVMPGNKMAYAGLKDPKRVETLIAYLKLFDKDGKTPTPAN